MDVCPTPVARNTVPYDDRRVCAGNTNCIPICPIQAKYDATVTINKALNTGNVTILYQSVASRVVVDPVSGKISGIDYITWKDPRGGASGKGTAVGKFYVLAAHAIETPRLLLMSATDQLPHGVANSSGQVGRNLMDHPLYLSWALMPEPIYPLRGPLSTSGIETLRDTIHRKDWAAFRIEIGNEGWNFAISDPYQTSQDFIDGTNVSQLNPEGLKLQGEALIQKLNGLMTRQFRMANLVEQEADPQSRVTLSALYTDRLGLPRPHIDYRLSEYTRQGFKKAREVNSAIYKALGATEYSEVYPDRATYFEVEGDEKGFNYYGAGHIMGTTLMGASKADSVVDPTMRSWDHDNLYIVGSGTFPATGTANPTLTIAALAFGAADTLSKRLSK
jgi:choline dehydrogenase-like flavoprotein